MTLASDSNPDLQAQHIQQLFMASTLHEIKNQLGDVMSTVASLKAQAKLADDAPQSQQLDHQFQLLNFRLGQLLQGYKHQQGYQLRLDYCNLDDLLAEAQIRHQHLQGVDVLSVAQDECYAHIDESLLTNVIDTMIYNAQQAGATQIQLNVIDSTESDSGVWLTLEDNGPGFPDTLIGDSLDQLKPGDVRENKSGLGLYMASHIVKAHKHIQSQGQLIIDNASSLGGARIRLYLP